MTILWISLAVVLFGLVVLGAYSLKRSGATAAEKKALEEDLQKVRDKKEINNEVNAMDDDALLDEFLDRVLERRKN